VDRARQLARNDLAAFAGSGEERSHFAKHVLTLETVQDSPQVFDIKVTECLRAKTFRELDAPDIGYALICHADYADCQGFNPRIVLSRSKTLMQGDECCDHRFVWDGKATSFRGPPGPAPEPASSSQGAVVEAAQAVGGMGSR
jgi:hypothetical protein